MNMTDEFVNSIERIAESEIPEHVYKRAEIALLDYLAVTVAGAKSNSDKLEKFFLSFAEDEGNSVLIGLRKKTNLNDSIFLNGLNSHALDFDDGTNRGIIHLGSPIFSVLIPLAEKYNISIEKMLKAAIIGYETSFTMAASIQPKHKKNGYHATGTCGVLGIAMSVAYMLDYSAEERRTAFDVATVSATGMLKVLDDSSQLKPYNVAKSALLGFKSVQMSKIGYIGHHDSLAGRGFVKMMTGDEKVTFCPPLLNGVYAIEKAYTKPYAACRYCHPAIEASIKIGKTLDYEEIQNIKSITVKTYDLAVFGHEHVDIQGIESAKMSIPYGVAVGLIHRKAGLSEYSNSYINDLNILSVAKKVNVIMDEEISRNFPQKQTSIVNVEFSNGKNINETIDFPKGEPENLMTKEEFENRFIELFEFAEYSIEQAKKIIGICKNKTNKVAELCKEV